MGLNPLEAPVEVSIALWPWGSYLGEEGTRNGIRAKVSSWERISPRSLIPAAKASGQYLNSVLAKIESVKAGYDEAILLDEHGHVCEGSGENIYIGARRRDRDAAADGVDPRRHQPPLGDPDRRATSATTVLERDIARAELYLADEVFLTGTAAELVPVREIDDHAIGDRRARARSRACSRRAFQDALYGRNERYLEWLDVVAMPPAAEAPRRRPASVPRHERGDLSLFVARITRAAG